MKLSEIIFVNQFPTLDLHGYDRDYARIKINEFIQDHFKMKDEFVVIVHGVGSGILRKETASTLKRNEKVEDYQLFKGNIGCTIVKIKKNEEKMKKIEK